MRGHGYRRVKNLIFNKFGKESWYRDVFSYIHLRRIVAYSPASLLIVLGFIAILLGWVFKESGFIVLGVILMAIGIIVHVMVRRFKTLKKGKVKQSLDSYLVISPANSLFFYVPKDARETST